MFSPPCNRDIKHRLDLPEVFIQHAAQIRQTLVVSGGKGNFYRFGLQWRGKATQYGGEVLILAATDLLCNSSYSGKVEIAFPIGWLPRSGKEIGKEKAAREGMVPSVWKEGHCLRC